MSSAQQERPPWPGNEWHLPQNAFKASSSTEHTASLWFVAWIGSLSTRSTLMGFVAYRNSDDNVDGYTFRRNLNFGGWLHQRFSSALCTGHITIFHRLRLIWAISISGESFHHRWWCIASQQYQQQQQNVTSEITFTMPHCVMHATKMSSSISSYCRTLHFRPSPTPFFLFKPAK